MKIIIASDHAGFSFKQDLLAHLSIEKNLKIIDQGPANEDRCDYPDYADKVVKALLEEMKSSTEPVYGILICGSGQGMAMRANKYTQIRAALCWSVESAQLSRAHNDANILCLGARLLTKDLANEIVQTFLHTPFEGERHAARVKKISNPTAN
jgi:ribose 5-phosphate isomerase B